MPFLRKYCFIFIFTICNGAAFFVGALFFLSKYPLIDFSVLERYDVGKPTILLDVNGNEWARFQVDKRQPIGIAAMPIHLIRAFVAAEDWKFFEHTGLSLRGIVRSALANMYHGRIVQGASTITQQLVKLLYFDMKRSFRRKIKEQLVTLLVERQFTKEHILQTYLNHIYFGCGIYGVEAAAQRFWNVAAQDLTIAQAATLAAIVCSPGNYCPLLYPLSCMHRRNIVLHKMAQLGFISYNDCTIFCNEPLTLYQPEKNNRGLHTKETIRTWLEEKYGKEMLYKGGLTVATTIDTYIQEQAEIAFNNHFLSLKKTIGSDVEGALITMDVPTGGIRALIGGYDFTTSQFNRALQAKRQQGSVFKPVVYATALEKGMSLLDTSFDEPLRIQTGTTVWEPRNHTRTFEGSMTLARALSYSNNIITIKTLLEVGVDAVIASAQKCHFSGPFYPYPSLALGCIDSTLDEVAGMFNIFAHQGKYVQPYLVVWVKDRWGKKIYKRTIVSERIFSHKIASQLNKALMAGLERRRKREISWIDSDAMSKTGTTNDSRTCWFAGSTPELTTVLYVGCDDNRPMGKNVYPLHTAYPIWLDLHKKIKTQKKQFSFDTSLRPVLVDWKKGTIESCLSNNEVHMLLI